jgi:hypothetical protein
MVKVCGAAKAEALTASRDVSNKRRSNMVISSWR